MMLHLKHFNTFAAKKWIEAELQAVSGKTYK